MPEIDDKIMVIVCVTGLAVLAMFQLTDPAAVVNSVVSGLFGVAVGKAIK